MDWTRGPILGRGSSGVVSCATSTSGEPFAVKSVELSRSENLQKEQLFLSILSSPYVVSYKGCDVTAEYNKIMYNILMEYMPGGTVIDCVHRRKKGFDVSGYTRQIVQGLEYLHLNGIVHCDIKGRNVLVGECGVKIGDLGCAKWVDDQEAPICGTPAFMAPEVARGEEQGFPADVWALGCTVIEMVTGASPWVNINDPVSVLYRIAFSGELPEIPDGFSDQAKDFVSKCLIRDPKERWTATELLKHPYLEQSNNHQKQIVCENTITDSPTSILDQDVWDSMEESSSSVVTDFVQPTCSSNSLRQRIKQLAGKSQMPNWRCENEETNWIMIRNNEDGAGKASFPASTGAVGDGIAVDSAINGDEDDELLISFLDTTKVSCRCKRCKWSGNSSLLVSCLCEHKCRGRDEATSFR